jgi:sugar-specific transcriptional regulator TrmB
MTLESLGLKRIEAEIYVYLAKNGPLESDHISACFKLTKQKTYYILKNMQKIGIVTINPQHPASFYALPIEEVLEIYIKRNLKQAQTINENKGELLATWESMSEQNHT